MKVYIRLADAIGPTLASAFEDLVVRTETVITGEVIDDAALHGLIARCRDLGIGMLDIHVEGRHESPEAWNDRISTEVSATPDGMRSNEGRS